MYLGESRAGLKLTSADIEWLVHTPVRKVEPQRVARGRMGRYLKLNGGLSIWYVWNPPLSVRVSQSWSVVYTGIVSTVHG